LSLDQGFLGFDGQPVKPNHGLSFLRVALKWE
jgi:hypothetical protein